MVSFIAVLVRLGSALSRALRSPEFRGLSLVVLVLLLSGTAFYSSVEGWRVLDALYFSVTTLATVGYGDLTPETDGGKLFTVAYIMVGVGLLVTFLAGIAQELAPARDDAASGGDGGTG